MTTATAAFTCSTALLRGHCVFAGQAPFTVCIVCCAPLSLHSCSIPSPLHPLQSEVPPIPLEELAEARLMQQQQQLAAAQQAAAAHQQKQVRRNEHEGWEVN